MWTPLFLIENFAVKYKTMRFFASKRILSRNRNCSDPVSSARGRAYVGKASVSRAEKEAALCGSNTAVLGFFFEYLAVRIPYPLIPSPRSFLKEGCIPARVYFNINNWRANFPRARARVISGRRDGDASVCDRDLAASRRLRHSVSLSFFSSSPFSPPLFCLPVTILSSLSFGILVQISTLHRKRRENLHEHHIKNNFGYIW